MQNQFTPDGLIVASLIAVAILSTFLWILIKARMNNGIAEVSSFLLFGWDGAAWSPSIIVINKDARNKKALIAHEQCHQAQQRKDGTLTFWFRYLTNKKARLAYEVEAYKVWLTVSPEDEWRIVFILVNSYGFGLTSQQAIDLLK